MKAALTRLVAVVVLVGIVPAEAGNRTIPAKAGSYRIPAEAGSYAIPAEAGVSGLLEAGQASSRRVRNAHEIHRELAIDPGSVGKVGEYFPAFHDYHDMIMFHPTFGYYASGRVSFSDDYQTFPIVLAPLFGHMIAEHLFQMWDGMRRSGALARTDTFTIGEFGAGDGALAESILEYIQAQANGERAGWAEFARQAVYVCYDRSPALNRIQKERNKRFGSRFDARVADATDLTATIRPGSLKGVVLSNELPDAFSVHKVILTTTDAPEVAFVAPSLSTSSWQRIRPLVPAALAAQVDAGDAAIERVFLRGARPADVYLTKRTFAALLDATVSGKDYESVVDALEFHEIYVPVSTVPELAAHLRRYARTYADVLARDDVGILTYVNLGLERMIQGAARILAAGYVITIDYGAGWDGILSNDGSQHLRTYGPAHRAASAGIEAIDNDSIDDVQTSDPYNLPTLNDLTTDVNFSLLDVEGRQAGLRTLFFGSQKALQSGTSVSLDEVPERARRERREDHFRSWVEDFRAPGVFKVMLQQKDGTDSRYRFPDDDPEPLEPRGAPLTPAQQQLAATIERRLAGR
jgi:SAM-dependent MidA family methyltransferase